MADSKSLLVIFVIAVANAKIINGSPVDMEHDDGYSSEGISGLSISTTRDGVTVDSYEIHETVGGMTSKVYSIINNSVLIGDESKMVYSGKPTELVIVEGNSCSKRTYSKRVLVSSETMSSSDCAKMKKKIQQIQHGSGSSSTNQGSSSGSSNALAEFWKQLASWMQHFQHGNNGKY